MKIIDLKCAIIGKSPVIRIVTDEGISGFGQTEWAKSYLKPFVLFYKPLIIGEDPANVEKVVVNESEGKKIETYFIKNLEANFEQLAATSASALHSRPYGAGSGMMTGRNVGTSVSNIVHKI